MKDILFIGDGVGHRTFCSSQLGLDAYGFDISKWAINNNPYNLGDRLFIDDIVNLEHNEQYKLIVCYDVLEHIEESELSKALDNCYKLGNNFIFSIPFEGDPNLLADKTHKIFKSKEWWLDKLTKTGFKIKETPEHFLFAHQIIIATKEDKK